MGSQDNISPMRRPGPMRAVDAPLPHSTAIEVELLGAIAEAAGVDNHALRVARDMSLLPIHFSSDDNAQLFKLCCELTDRGDAPVLPLLLDTLEQRHPHDEALRLFTVINVASTSAIGTSVESFVRRIQQTWKRRQMMIESARIAAIAYDESTPFEPDMASVIERVGRLTAPDPWVSAQLVTSLAELAAQTLPDLHLIVQPILSAGLTILGGRPKIGKSFLAFNIGLSVSCGSGKALGGFTSAEAGEVLYLALEDTPRRLVERARQMCGDDPLPSDLYIATRWPRINEGGAALIDQWCRQHERRKLVICDTLAMIQPVRKEGENGSLYTADYEAVRPLKEIGDRYDIAVLVPHHMRKTPSSNEDVLEELSGTYGLSGAADTIWGLKRDPMQREGTLEGRGRDVEEFKWAMDFDFSTGIWKALGDSNGTRLSSQQREIVELIRIHGPLTPTKASNLLGENLAAIKQRMARMRRGDILSVTSNGVYSLHESPTVTG